jgi:hypothetical protein
VRRAGGRPILIGQDRIRLRARTSRSDMDRYPRTWVPNSFAGHPWVVPRRDMVWSAIFNSASFVQYVNFVKGVSRHVCTAVWDGCSRTCYVGMPSPLSLLGGRRALDRRSWKRRQSELRSGGGTR